MNTTGFDWLIDWLQNLVLILLLWFLLYYCCCVCLELWLPLKYGGRDIPVHSLSRYRNTDTISLIHKIIFIRHNLCWPGFINVFLFLYCRPATYLLLQSYRRCDVWRGTTFTDWTHFVFINWLTWKKFFLISIKKKTKKN